MRPPAARVLAAAALVVMTMAPRAGATPETTCRAAAARDGRVDYGFCVSRLSHHRDSPDADDWGLAKVAADVGVAAAGDAVYDIDGLLASSSSSRPGPSPPARAALRRCRALYDGAELAFAEAYDAINRRDYAAGKARAAEAASLARRCGAAFARAGAAPPPPQLARWGEEAVKIAAVCTAITGVLK